MLSFSGQLFFSRRARCLTQLVLSFSQQFLTIWLKERVTVRKGPIPYQPAVMGETVGPGVGLVCLLDTNLNGGHVRLRLNVMSEHSIVSVASMYAGAKNNNSDWSSAQWEINQEMEKFLIPVPGSSDVNGRYNFFCIPGITNQEQARSPYLKAEACGEFMRSLIDYLKQRFDFVVIDVGSSINVPLHRESFKNSDVILVVCDADA
ncbi:MAG: hypothetical protein IJH54_04470, partial [Clostridia bacterium]|nr:hypothetical protein [Clostridia bacterium]